MREIGSYVMLALVAVFAVEAFVSSRWLPSYFRSGPIVFSKRIVRRRSSPGLPLPGKLEFELRSPYVPGLLFRTLSADEIAFREPLFDVGLFSYSPVMHGHIEAGHGGSVFVRGRLNWSTLVLFVALSLFLHEEGLVELMVLLLAAFASLYVVQAFRFRRVGAVVAEEIATRD